MSSPWKDEINIIPLEKIQLSKVSFQKKKSKLWKQNLVISVIENKLLNTDAVGHLNIWIELSQSFVSRISYYIVGLFLGPWSGCFRWGRGSPSDFPEWEAALLWSPWANWTFWGKLVRPSPQLTCIFLRLCNKKFKLNWVFHIFSSTLKLYF